MNHPVLPYPVPDVDKRPWPLPPDEDDEEDEDDEPYEPGAAS